MNMTSSTAEVMNGDGGGEYVVWWEAGWNRGRGRRSGGGSSSWKAVSTVRRMKKVVRVRKGLRRREEILVEREELEMIEGRVSGGGSVVVADWSSDSYVK